MTTHTHFRRQNYRAYANSSGDIQPFIRAVKRIGHPGVTVKEIHIEASVDSHQQRFSLLVGMSATGLSSRDIIGPVTPGDLKRYLIIVLDKVRLPRGSYIRGRGMMQGFVISIGFFFGNNTRKGNNIMVTLEHRESKKRQYVVKHIFCAPKTKIYYYFADVFFLPKTKT